MLIKHVLYLAVQNFSEVFITAPKNEKSFLKCKFRYFTKIPKIRRDVNTTGYMNTDLAKRLGYDRIVDIKEIKSRINSGKSHNNIQNQNCVCQYNVLMQITIRKSRPLFL